MGPTPFASQKSFDYGAHGLLRNMTPLLDNFHGRNECRVKRPMASPRNAAAFDAHSLDALIDEPLGVGK